MSDGEIWAALREISERTGWPAPACIDAVSMDTGVDRDRVAQIWIERQLMMGAG